MIIFEKGNAIWKDNFTGSRYFYEISMKLPFGKVMSYDVNILLERSILGTRIFIIHPFFYPVPDRDQHIETLSSKIEDVMATNADLSLSKVKLEMKAVELEELKDRLDEERTELISNISELRKYSEETCKNLMEVQKAHTNLNKQMQALQEEQKKFQNSQRLHDEDMLEKAETIKEQKVALSQMEKLLHDKTNEMSDFLIQADQVRIIFSPYLIMNPSNG
jgi:hypothetical protein